MAKTLKKHMDIDVIAFFEEQMKKNTLHYQSDFEIDKEIIMRSAKSQRKEDKNLLWMSRPNGTHCHREYEAFIQGSSAYITWRFYAEQTSDPIVACAVELIGIQNGVVRGNVYELDYRALVSEIVAKAVPSLEVEKIFEDGFVAHMPLERSSYGYCLDLVDEHGPIVDSLTIPCDKRQLMQVLFEQKAFRNKIKKNSIDFQIQSASTRAAESCVVSEVKIEGMQTERD